MEVIFVEICVACWVLAATATSINLLQSMVLVVLVPEVVMELVELDEEDDEDEVLLLVLLTVMTGTCQKKNRAGTMPAR